MACQHKNHDWEKDGSSYFVCADCGWESWDNTEWLPPYESPNWDEAPEWARSHGLCRLEGDSSYMQWCYMGGTYPEGFTHIERRPPQPPQP